MENLKYSEAFIENNPRTLADVLNNLYQHWGF